MYTLIGHPIYNRGLHDAQKEIVNEAHEKENIDFLQRRNPVEVALQIVKLVAVDPPMAMVTRLISPY